METCTKEKKVVRPNTSTKKTNSSIVNVLAGMIFLLLALTVIYFIITSLLATPSVQVIYKDNAYAIVASQDIWNDSQKKKTFKKDNILELLRKAKTTHLSLKEASLLLGWLRANKDVLSKCMKELLAAFSSDSVSKAKNIVEIKELIEVLKKSKQKYRVTFAVRQGWRSFDAFDDLLDRAILNLHRVDVISLNTSNAPVSKIVKKVGQSIPLQQFEVILEPVYGGWDYTLLIPEEDNKKISLDDFPTEMIEFLLFTKPSQLELLN